MKKTLPSGAYELQAKKSAQLSEIFNADNCSMVTSLTPCYRSWIPGRQVNGLKNIEAGHEYHIITKTDLQLGNWFKDI